MISRSRTATLLVALLLTACTAMATEPPEPTPTGPVVRVGTGPEAESRLLADVVAELLAAEGYRPVVVDRADAQAARQALEVGDVDLLPGYTGQAWLEVVGRANPPDDPRTSFARVRSVDETNGILWLRPAFDLDAGIDGPPANATFGFFVRGVPSADAHVRTLPQLARLLPERPEARVCVDRRFAERPDGWAVVADRYSIAERPLYDAAPADAMRGVAAGECLVGLSTRTDGHAWHAGLQLLDDPLGVFPAFVVTVQARQAVVDEDPGVAAALEPLVAQLTTRMLGTWNGEVAAGRPRADVAGEAASSLRSGAGLEPIAPSPTG